MLINLNEWQERAIRQYQNYSNAKKEEPNLTVSRYARECGIPAATAYRYISVGHHLVRKTPLVLASRSLREAEAAIAKLHEYERQLEFSMLSGEGSGHKEGIRR